MLTQLRVANAGRRMLFVNGGVWIPCGDVLTLGDVNLNGISDERADLNLLGQYITSGESALPIRPTNDLSATEINGDGIPGDVTDFVYLMRRVSGNEKLDPFLKEFSYQDTVTLRHTNFSITTNRELAVLLLVFNGPAKVTVHDKNLQMTQGQIDGDTYVLIYGRIAGEGHILRHGQIVDHIETPLISPGAIVELDGALKRAEAANYDGYKLHTVITH